MAAITIITPCRQAAGGIDNQHVALQMLLFGSSDHAMSIRYLFTVEPVLQAHLLLSMLINAIWQP